MHHLTWGSVLAVFGTSGVVTWLGATLSQRSGIAPLQVPFTVVVVCVLVGAVTLWLAWAVRQYLAGKRPQLDPLRAARTVVLAQASAYTGAMLAGAFVGYGIAIAANWDHVPRRELAIDAGIAALGALVLLACGWIAERWCRIDPPKRDSASVPGGTLAT